MRKDRARLDQIDEDARSGGLLSRLFAEEDEHDRGAFWRLGSWGAATVGAVAAAMLVAHYSSGVQRDRQAFAEMTRENQQLQVVEKEVRIENRRLSAAVETLNTDRDRLFARVTSVEQNLESITGALAKPSAAASHAWPKTAVPFFQTPPIANPVPVLASAPPVKPAAPPSSQAPPAVDLPTLPVKKVTPAPEPETHHSPPQAATSHAPSHEAAPETVAALAPPAEAAASEEPVQEKTVRPTEFGVDLGSANSVEGLRAVWRGALKRGPDLVGALQPLIVVREGHNGLGMRLHLVAGPLNDAAAAAKLCAAVLAHRHRCETALFDGQRLALESPLGAKVSQEKPRRQARSRTEKRVEEPAPQPQPAQAPPPAEEPPSRGLSSLFGR
ncbi:conserved hypothetical protein [Afipia carboxidovorans OM5]|uniref:SPOR domain-containing protein n=1 Tax=Afipia carboxidovorans (strain ATCC 49405 / DSM 1227 / KCTC 32145 / OM5) TaxID=504832 RepID=B6JFB3_AFIC5|nr:hypothetical protein [Afipia carboxidovorans]ACI93332.1 conserved hypothetical protein [Afipia carboxidovorans OM5]AEI02950.1 hypothetical protein OCA4_c18130 [Afipia carboxidovorans OM4]AEI06526.1 hypothetical protein OCA5_c18130 [Afipia carboxidovorans OM5]